MRSQRGWLVDCFASMPGAKTWAWDLVVRHREGHVSLSGRETSALRFVTGFQAFYYDWAGAAGDQNFRRWGTHFLSGTRNTSAHILSSTLPAHGWRLGGDDILAGFKLNHPHTGTGLATFELLHDIFRPPFGTARLYSTRMMPGARHLIPIFGNGALGRKRLPGYRARIRPIEIRR